MPGGPIQGEDERGSCAGQNFFRMPQHGQRDPYRHLMGLSSNLNGGPRNGFCSIKDTVAKSAKFHPDLGHVPKGGIGPVSVREQRDACFLPQRSRKSCRQCEATVFKTDGFSFKTGHGGGFFFPWNGGQRGPGRRRDRGQEEGGDVAKELIGTNK